MYQAGDPVTTNHNGIGRVIRAYANPIPLDTPSIMVEWWFAEESRWSVAVWVDQRELKLMPDHYRALWEWDGE